MVAINLAAIFNFHISICFLSYLHTFLTDY